MAPRAPQRSRADDSCLYSRTVIGGTTSTCSHASRKQSTHIHTPRHATQQNHSPPKPQVKTDPHYRGMPQTPIAVYILLHIHTARMHTHTRAHTAPMTNLTRRPPRTGTEPERHSISGRFPTSSTNDKTRRLVVLVETSDVACGRTATHAQNPSAATAP